MERFGPTRRGGPVFRWLGEPLAIDLANTVMVVRDGESVDLLATAEELAIWLNRQRPRIGDCDFALRNLTELRAAREDIRALLAAAEREEALPAGPLERVNALSAAAPVAARLAIDEEGRPPRLEQTAEARGMTGLLGSLARSTIELVAEHPQQPVKVCRAPSCGMFFRGRRRWCCAACGNRARAARHYRRLRSGNRGSP
ncbi:MAG TPA: ABATE domain-containing protein [Solirubrobacterales bacterium]|jgi:predicted RNA-binding Zn ribbon-like protein